MNRLDMARRVKALAGRPLEAGRPWYRIANEADDGPARVDVYDEIGGSWWSDGVSAADFVARMAAIPLSRAIEVHINSPGGDVFDGLAIYNAIAARPGPVTTIVDGLAASAASFIAQAGKIRLACPGSMMMIHDASGICIGNAADMQEMAGLLDIVSGNIADIYAAHSGRTADEFREAMQAETWYKATDAVEAKLADRLAERPAPEDATNSHDLSMFARVPDWARAAAAAGGGSAAAPAARPAVRVLGLESMPLANEALPVHHTATADKPWDGPAAVKGMPNDAKVLRYCHAWQDSASDDGSTADDPDGDADDRKSSYKFPHHETDGGPANVNACSNGLARLSGADIPDGDRAGVEAHLRAHLKDAGHDEDEEGAGNHAHQHDDSRAAALEQIRAALPALKGARA